MKLRTYKVLRGYYNEIKEKELHIPEGAKFLYKDGICGDCVHTGHNHYIVILRKEDYTSEDIDTIVKADTSSLIAYDEFDDLYILTIRDIKFLEEYPVITTEEAMTEFSLGKYYVVWKKKDYIDEDTICDIRSGKITFKEGVSLLKQGKIYKCGKILKFAGPYSITMAIVHTGNYFNDRPMYGIDIVTGVEFKNISSDFIDTIANDTIIVTKDPSYFEQLKNEVLYQIDNYTE
jgi:hypothetical protein